MQDESERPSFLPPQPAGPEPDLGSRPAEPTPAPQAPPPPPPPPPPVAPQQQPPQQTYGYPPPPPGYAYPPQPQWSYPQQAVPGNGQAVTGFVLSVVGVSLLFLSAGLSSILSLGLSIGGIVCSRNGRKMVDEGKTPKHRSLAQAGFVVGWVGVFLSILAIVGWVLVFAIGGADDGSSPFDPDTTTALARVLWG